VTDAQVNEERQIAEHLAEITQCLASFQSRLPREFNFKALALARSMSPYRAVVYRDTLMWRITELGQSALENFNQTRLSAAILLSRAAIETASALWYLQSKIAATVEADRLGDVDDDLVRLQLGTRVFEGPHLAINVLNFLDDVDKRFPGFRKCYEALSEYAHPNFPGTTGLYSASDFSESTVSFGAHASASRQAEVVGVGSLRVAMFMFDYCYAELDKLMPEFVAVCEKTK
jgi:hypothetical protein